MAPGLHQDANVSLAKRESEGGVIDWQTIVLNLRRAGISNKFIYAQTGIHDTTVSHYVRGTAREPTFSRGLALLKLHRKFCEEAHMRDVYEKA